MRSSAPLLIAGLALAVGSCQAHAETDLVVEMNRMDRYEPAVVSVPVGTTITWHNRGTRSHTATSDEDVADNPDHAQRPDGAEGWDSGPVGVGDTFTHRFDETGEYVYFCRFLEQHGMIGRIVVTAAP